MDKTKKICRPEPVPEPETIPVPPVAPVPDYLKEESVSLLNEEQLGRIAKSGKVKEMLQNEGLRRLVRLIDSSENPEYLLDKARKDNQLFVEFSEELLATIERDPGQSGTEQVLEAMGMGAKP
ncbi:hypothetical protein BGX33_004446 [Mortierella sp. NVP41]|nr:hypothetical protein BGX33_004446 [Mortierella sp. NVP41]